MTAPLDWFEPLAEPIRQTRSRGALIFLTPSQLIAAATGTIKQLGATVWVKPTANNPKALVRQIGASVWVKPTANNPKALVKQLGATVWIKIPQPPAPLVATFSFRDPYIPRRRELPRSIIRHHETWFSQETTTAIPSYLWINT